MKPRGQHQLGAVGQELVIGAVLIHDREPLHPIGRRAALGDIHDPGIEVARLPGDPFVHRIRDLMGHAPPVVRGRGEAQPAQLDAGEHVPEPELHLQLAAGIAAAADLPGDQGLGVDLAPVGEAGQGAQLLG